MITSEQVEDAAREAVDLKERYLRQQGWEYKCNYPDSCWRWEKTLPSGQALTTTADRAFNMESEFLDVSETGDTQ